MPASLVTFETIGRVCYIEHPNMSVRNAKRVPKASQWTMGISSVVNSAPHEITTRCLSSSSSHGKNVLLGARQTRGIPTTSPLGLAPPSLSPQAAAILVYHTVTH